MVLEFFADAKHHCGRRSHAELVRGAVHVEPVFGQALQARNAVAHFVVENLRAAAGDGVKPGVAQAHDGVTNGEPAVLGDGDNFRSRIAVKMNFEALLDAAQHLLMPVDLQVGMQAALHQHARAAEFDGLANLFVDGFEVENVSLFRLGPLQRTIERAEGAVLGAVVRVIDVAIDDLADHAVGVQRAANGVGFHPDADQIVGTVEFKGLGVSEGHGVSGLF